MRLRVHGGWAGAAAWLLLSTAVGAAEPGNAGVERERIRLERAAAVAQFDAAARACQDRFAVTDCVNAARQAQRDTLAGLRRQEAVLEEAARRQRAAQRMADIRAKVSAQESRARAPATATRRNSAIRVAPPRELMGEPAAPRPGRVAPASPQPPRAAPAPAARASEGRTAAAERAEREQARRAAFDAKARSAQAHRDAALQRSEERARTGKASQPLPQEPAASAP